MARTPFSPASSPPRESAVLMPLFERDGQPRLLFIKRSERVGMHKGEIGFPGGRIETYDLSRLDAALREAEEELGIPATDVTPLGALPPVSTIVSSMVIYPFAGRLSAPPLLVPDPYEVAETLEVPLATLLDPATCRIEEREIRGTTRSILLYRCGPHDIWGATGRIVQQFLTRLWDWPAHDPTAPWTLDQIAEVLGTEGPGE